ncbi:hypothetical protein C8J57DRAFT_1511353 [Mycena rebaudengoi]|nr:hypothetical protein C8J57DRAFT_1511353 [Mycena rebaudengoi]
MNDPARAGALFRNCRLKALGDAHGAKGFGFNWVYSAARRRHACSTALYGDKGIPCSVAFRRVGPIDGAGAGPLRADPAVALDRYNACIFTHRETFHRKSWQMEGGRHLRRPSILLLILPNPLCTHFSTHVAPTLNTSKPLAEAAKLEDDEAANADELEHPQAGRVGNGVQANNSVSAVATSTSTSTATTSIRPFDAPHAPKDVLERARSQDSMRLATLGALLLRYLCVSLPALPPPPMRYKLLQENVTALRTAALPRARKSSSSNLRSSGL